MLPKEIYKTIKNVALKKQGLSPGMSSIDFAKQLGIDVKNKAQSTNDFFPGANPLEQVHAVLTKTKDGYVIYYDDSQVYKNYFILHESAHYVLKHCCDTPSAEEHANLLACMLLIPPDLLIARKLFTANDILKEIPIPESVVKYYIEVLETYENEYIRKKYIWKVVQWIRTHKIQAVIYMIMILVLGTGMALLIPRNHITYVPAPTSTPVSTPASTSTMSVGVNSDMIITKSGDKYHIPQCKHVRDKKNTTIITVEEAVRLGYAPCADCIK